MNKIDVKFKLSKWGFRFDVLRYRDLESIKNAKFDVLFHLQAGYFVPILRRATKKYFFFSFDILCFDKPTSEGARWQLGTI